MDVRRCCSERSHSAARTRQRILRLTLLRGATTRDTHTCPPCHTTRCAFWHTFAVHLTHCPQPPPHAAASAGLCTPPYAYTAYPNRHLPHARHAVARAACATHYRHRLDRADMALLLCSGLPYRVIPRTSCTAAYAACVRAWDIETGRDTTPPTCHLLVRTLLCSWRGARTTFAFCSTLQPQTFACQPDFWRDWCCVVVVGRCPFTFCCTCRACRHHCGSQCCGWDWLILLCSVPFYLPCYLVRTRCLLPQQAPRSAYYTRAAVARCATPAAPHLRATLPPHLRIRLNQYEQALTHIPLRATHTMPLHATRTLTRTPCRYTRHCLAHIAAAAMILLCG